MWSAQSFEGLIWLSEKMNRIVHVIDELKVGGAQTHLITMLREMTSRGLYEHEVWGLFEDGPVSESLRDLGIPVRALDLRRNFGAFRFDRAARTIQEEIRRSRPDLVEAHLTWSRLLGLWAAQREGVPRRIGFEQGDIYLNSLPFRLANFAGQALAHHIVVCSRALADWVHTTHRVSRSRLEVLHNCVDTERFQPSNRRSRPNEWPNVSTLFCAVGTLGSGVNKRMDLCIRAIAEARAAGADVGLVICGDGNQRPVLEALIDDLNVREVIQILGMRDDIPQVVASCDAFCHAAPFEPFGIVCIEAMASGVPVIVPDAGGISEAVEHGETGWVYPVLNTLALAGHMTDLHHDPARRKRMGKAAREAAVARFTVRHYVDRLTDLYALDLGPQVLQPAER